MLGFFFSIIVLTAGIASGVLFYMNPQILQANVKGTATIASPVLPTPTVAVIIDDPTGESTPSPTSILTTIPTQTGQNFKRQLIIPSLTPIPTITESLTPTPTTEPLELTTNSINTPIPTDTITPTPQPTVTQVQNATSSNQSGLQADIVFSLVNNHRTSIGLSSLQKDTGVCTAAQQRAPQVYNEIFVTGNLDAGLKAMNLPYWATENIIYDDTEQDAVDWWLNDPTHRQIIEGNYKYSCVACSGYACAEVFTNYIAK